MIPHLTTHGLSRGRESPQMHDLIGGGWGPPAGEYDQNYQALLAFILIHHAIHVFDQTPDQPCYMYASLLRITTVVGVHVLVATAGRLLSRAAVEGAMGKGHACE